MTPIESVLPLKLGDRNEWVYAINTVLSFIHYYDKELKENIFLLYPPFADSDYFGPETADAVRIFKVLALARRIPITGVYTLDPNSSVVDMQTYLALDDVAKKYELPGIVVTAKRDKPKAWILPVIIVGLLLLTTQKG